MKITEDPQLHQAATQLAASITHEQSLAGRDLAVSVLRDVEKHLPGGQRDPGCEQGLRLRDIRR